MEWYEVVIALLAAFGGGASVIRLIKTIVDWRKGVQQREAAPTERLVAHLERRINDQGDRIVFLETAREVDGAYITVLVLTMAEHGIQVPPRPRVEGEKP